MDNEIATALREMGFGEALAMDALSGGVSCDVLAVDLPGRKVCVKRALPKLRVAADWRAPPERSGTEAAWLNLVARLDARFVPAVLGEDRTRHLLVMEYLPPDRHPVWKALLADGRVDSGFAARTGAALSRIHAFTAGRADIAAAFDTRAQFHALRVEPYLLFTATRNPDVALVLRGIADDLARSSIALMQGDISPKNILCGPHGPVFLDAETACYGDPAFDLAFCLTHLVLKSAWHPQHANGLGDAFRAFAKAYFESAAWEPRAALERRACRFVSALLLARIDGKSPVEYLTSEEARFFVRARAKEFLSHEPLTLNALWERWSSALNMS